MNFREKLKQLRKNLGWSSRKAADAIRLSHVNLIRIENGFDSKGIVKESIQLDVLKDLLNAYDYDFTLFLYETGYLSNDRIAITDEEVQLLSGFRSGKYEMEKSDILAKQKRINKL